MSKHHVARVINRVLTTVQITVLTTALLAFSPAGAIPPQRAGKTASPDTSPDRPRSGPTPDASVSGSEGGRENVRLSADGHTSDATSPATSPASRPAKAEVAAPIPRHGKEGSLPSAPGSSGAGPAKERPAATKTRPARGSSGASSFSHSKRSRRRNAPPWSRVAQWMNIQPGITWYVSYEYKKERGISTNRFQITRGYVTLKFRPTDWFHARITLDQHQDDSGDWKVRLKYLYAQFILPWESRILTNPSLEVGLVHNPWFDYEEHINRYRAEGPMFIERNEVLNSADMGLTFGVLLGRRLDKAYREKVNPKYPGEFGSIQMGIYNGGGYHAWEVNENKVFMTRESIRPLGSWFPNLQLTHFFIFGRSNLPLQICVDPPLCVPGQPRWILNLFMASMEHQYFTVTGQYALGKGSQSGKAVEETNIPLSLEGYSIFGEIKLPWIHSSVMTRFDWFEWKHGTKKSLVLAGVAYHFFRHNFLLLSFDRATIFAQDKTTEWHVKATIQVHL